MNLAKWREKKNHTKNFFACFALLAMSCAVLVSPQVQAQSTEPASKNQSIESAKEIRGTIVKVDAERGRLSIRHPGIESLGMPAMVMAFKVGDRVDTQGLGINDAVSFKASRVDGAYTLISIKPLDQLEPSASRPSPGIKFE